MNTTHSSYPTSDREALSALFDGELVGDAARFALKRLDHDQEWRASCERWQRIGDALRGQGAPLPASFPARVHDALRAEAAVGAVPAQRRSNSRWGSVGLAASAALVAFFLARMPMERSAPDDAARVAAAATQPRPGNAPVQAPSLPDPILQQATAAAAVAAIARPVSERVAQRQRAERQGRAATDRIVSTAVAARSAQATGEVAQPVRLVAEAPAIAPVDANASPFAPAEARPWPRAVLPQLGSGALAADYSTTSPSFYPFTPATRQSLEPAANDDPADTMDAAREQR
jgi:Meckel syndrome type 1 protein